MNDFEDDDDEDEDEEDVTEGECTLHWLSMYNNNNNDFISIALFHAKHAQLR